MSPLPAKLIVRFGPHPNQEYPLPEHTVTIGREPINDIVMNDPEVSRRHTRISYRDGQFLAEDLGSTNGTFINGRRLTGPSPLFHGDIVDLGDSISFTFHDPAGAGGSATMIDSPGSGRGQPEQMARTEMIQQSSPRQSAAWQPASQPAARQPARETYYPVTPVEEPYDPTERITGPMPPTPVRPVQGGGRSSTRIVVGCGCLLLLATVFCIATFFLLDSYNGGVLLYCGPLRGLWEAILGATSIAQQCATV